jgi:tRNA threonylcarbamoyladenosine biosynthesis protein TsaE
MVTFISHSPAETENLGRKWGRLAEKGLVIALSGDLGAGKTRFVTGFAAGLGTTSRVQSPTFSLVNVYIGGRLPLFHVDLYRLQTHEEIIAAGLEEYFEPEGVCIIEWAERWFVPEIPNDALTRAEQTKSRLRWVHLEAVNESTRRIQYEDFGA